MLCRLQQYLVRSQYLHSGNATSLSLPHCGEDFLHYCALFPSFCRFSFVLHFLLDFAVWGQWQVNRRSRSHSMQSLSGEDSIWSSEVQTNMQIMSNQQIGRIGRWDVPSADRPICRLDRIARLDGTNIMVSWTMSGIPTAPKVLRLSFCFITLELALIWTVVSIVQPLL